MARTLDENYVEQIINMVNDGMTNKDIAECLGTKPGNVQYVRSTHKDRITFSRFKGGKIARTIDLPPKKEEEDVFKTTEVLMTAERTVILGGLRTVLWYEIKSDGTIKIFKRGSSSESLTIDDKVLHGYIEELMRLAALIPKIKVTDMESW